MEDEPPRTKRKWLVRWEQHPEVRDSWEEESRLLERCPGLLSQGLAQLVGRREEAARAAAQQRREAEARAARAEAKCDEMERRAQAAEAKARRMQSEGQEAESQGCGGGGNGCAAPGHVGDSGSPGAAAGRR